MQHIWYVAYGSNLSRERFCYYLRGGRPDGVERDYQGQVRFIASEAEFTPYYSLTAADRSRLSFLAEVVFDEAEAQTLPSGIPVDVTLALASP